MKKIGIIGAMELEVEALKEQMDVKNIIEKASMKFYEGMLRGKDVVIVQCGIGKVNAGICVQILADLFQVDAVINTGVAGSLRAEINIGDIVVSTDACEHDMDVTALGYKQGIIPQMKESFFKADRQLVEAAIEVCREVNPDINVYEGRVLSGDQFISGEEIKNKLIDLFDGSCTEMEGAAIAHAAFLNEIPYVVIRAISDNAKGVCQTHKVTVTYSFLITCAIILSYETAACCIESSHHIIYQSICIGCRRITGYHRCIEAVHTKLDEQVGNLEYSILNR